MKVVNRKNEIKEVKLLTIHDRIYKACEYAKISVKDIDPVELSTKVSNNITDMITTSELDDITSSMCMNLSTTNPKYKKLGSMIAISNHQKNCPSTFDAALEHLFNGIKREDGERWELIDPKIYSIAKKYKQEIQDMIHPERDFLFDYFGFKTLEKSYLLKDIVKQRPIETPQYMWIRVSLGIHKEDIVNVKLTYDLLSQKMFTHATPTLFNSGTIGNNMISCFLLGIEDSIEGMYKAVSDCAKISKFAGGIGLHISAIRSSGSIVKTTNGVSTGIRKYLRVLNDTARHVNQGGKRAGSFAVYLCPSHPDVYDFLDAGRNQGSETDKSRDLFYAMWIPDAFMEAVIEMKEWYLINPAVCDDLLDLYGERYTKRYYQIVEKYRHTKNVKQIQALDLWNHILTLQKETGMPYITYKCHINRKSPQKNVGTIRSSNLCVAPETRILTKDGYFPIKTLVEQEIEVWNGQKWSKTQVIQTGKNQKLIKLTFSNGSILHCTEYHRFFIEEGSRPSSRNVQTRIEAKDLKIGMKLIKHHIGMVEDNNEEFKYAYTSGFHSGDGTYIIRKNGTKRPMVSLYAEKKDLLDHLDIRTSSFEETCMGVINVSLPHDLPEKFKVPINYSLNSKLRWLEGYLDADGYISRNGSNQSLQASSIDFNFLNDIKLMLQTIGIDSEVTKLRVGKGGHELYDCKECHRILISSYSTDRLLDLGFNPKRLALSKSFPNRDVRKFITVVGIEDQERYSDTYCFNEPERHMGMFEGILTGNCSEITLYSDTKEYACCNLVSLRLHSFLQKPPVSDVRIYGKENCIYCKLAKAYLHSMEIEFDYIPLDDLTICEMFYKKFEVSSVPQIFVDVELIGGFTELLEKIKYTFDYEKLKYTIQTAVNNLNKIIDSNHYPVPETKLSNLRHRPIGIGVQGLANVFEKMWWGYQSPQAKQLNKEIFEHIYYYALEASVQLAKIHGPYETFKGSPMSEGILQFDMWGVSPVTDLNWDFLKKEIMEFGLYNSNLVALMPTSSTAQILGSNESFEAFTSNMYTRSTNAGEFTIVRDTLLEILDDLGLWDETMKNRIMFHRGKIGQIPDIPKIIKEIYLTSWEMSNKVSIDMARDRGVYICQTQSLNMFIEDPSLELLSKIHTYSWKQGLKTGSYYIRTKSATNATSFTISPLLEDLFKEEERECLSCGS